MLLTFMIVFPQNKKKTFMMV